MSFALGGSGGLLARWLQLKKRALYFLILVKCLPCCKHQRACSSPTRYSSFTLIMSLRIRATQKVHSTIMLDSHNTTAKHSTDQDTRPIEDQKRKGINGLLGSLFLREPSGSALAKAQAQHKLSAKAKSTAPKRRDTRTSAESDKSSLPTSLASRPSISSTSTSLRSSKS
jgi:hypothetical protein